MSPHEYTRRDFNCKIVQLTLSSLLLELLPACGARGVPPSEIQAPITQEDIVPFKDLESYDTERISLELKELVIKLQDHIDFKEVQYYDQLTPDQLDIIRPIITEIIKRVTILADRIAIAEEDGADPLINPYGIDLELGVEVGDIIQINLSYSERDTPLSLAFGNFNQLVITDIALLTILGHLFRIDERNTKPSIYTDIFANAQRIANVYISYLERNQSAITIREEDLARIYAMRQALATERMIAGEPNIAELYQLTDTSASELTSPKVNEMEEEDYYQAVLAYLLHTQDTVRSRLKESNIFNEDEVDLISDMFAITLFGDNTYKPANPMDIFDCEWLASTIVYGKEEDGLYDIGGPEAELKVDRQAFWEIITQGGYGPLMRSPMNQHLVAREMFGLQTGELTTGVDLDYFAMGAIKPNTDGSMRSIQPFFLIRNGFRYRKGPPTPVTIKTGTRFPILLDAFIKIDGEDYYATYDIAGNEIIIPTNQVTVFKKTEIFPFLAARNWYASLTALVNGLPVLSANNYGMAINPSGGRINWGAHWRNYANYKDAGAWLDTAALAYYAANPFANLSFWFYDTGGTLIKLTTGILRLLANSISSTRKRKKITKMEIRHVIRKKFRNA